MSTPSANERPAGPGEGELGARLPRAGGDEEALGGPLQVLAGRRVHGALGEHLVAAGERPALAVAELAERLADDLLGELGLALDQPGPGRLDRDAPLDLGRRGVRELDGAVDVGDRLVDPPDLAVDAGAQQQQLRIALDRRAEAGEQAEHRPRLDASRRPTR